jgi:hypothetical protein
MYAAAKYNAAHPKAETLRNFAAAAAKLFFLFAAAMTPVPQRAVRFIAASLKIGTI